MIKIIADSTCDLGKERIEKLGVDIIPLHVHMGDKEYKDGIDITCEDIYKWVEENNAIPKTAAVSLGDVIDTFEKYLADEDCEIICFGMSGKMSSTSQIMQMAVEELEAEDRIHVIDSENLSTGIGHLIIEAVNMVEEGLTAKEIVEKVNELKEKIRTSFVVDTLEYLHKGGRCSSISALVGGAIKLHPTIAIEDGKMVPKKKYRGKMAAVANSYLKDMKDGLLNADGKRVFITHCESSDEVIEKVCNYLKELNVFEEIIVTKTGSVVTCHCGPGTISVIYMSK